MTNSASNDRFALEDLLYTRTDERGVIQAGNDVFQRVSVYSWGKLIGAPHKILRHADMPKGVFFTIWESLKAGNPIAGYVQNMAEDGVPYWVLATLLPFEGGYISIRFKPSSAHLDKIIPLYGALRQKERAGGISPKDSAQQLEASLQEMGFSDYNAFMSVALRDEVGARDLKLGRKRNEVSSALSEMLVDVQNMEKLAADIDTVFRNTHQIPYNMRLQAGRLEGSDGPISVISSNHRLMTQKLEENMEQFSEDSRVGVGSVRLAVFLTCAATLADELKTNFAADHSDLPFDKQTELACLTEIARQYREISVDDINGLTEKVRRFGQQCRDMRRMMSGLELTRIMCKIERSKFEEEHAGLDEIVNKLADAQAALSTAFNDILKQVTVILDLSETVVRATEDIDLIQVA